MSLTIRTLIVNAVSVFVLAGSAAVAAEAARSPEAVAARAELDRVLDEIGLAARQWSHDPNAFVDALPAEVKAGNEAAFAELLALTPQSPEAQLAPLSPEDAQRGRLEQDAIALAGRFAPGTNAVAMTREVQEALATENAAGWRQFKGHFLHPSLPAPYGNLAPQCENHWCVPDFYRSDYDDLDLDLRLGNYCTVVPDLWFRWPCYQHDVGFTFAPQVTSSKLGSFLAINWQWWGDMRSECHERIRFDWVNPEFIACQAVALSYYIAVNVFSFPIFNEPNGVKGYDALEGADPDLRHPPVFRRWNACTGTYTQSAPFVSWNGRVLGAAASVPQGTVLELSGRTHRGTRILFGFFDEAGALVANHLTEKAGDNCIVAQEPERFSTQDLAPGAYRVKARYYAWEGGPNETDAAYDPPRVVAHGLPTYNETVLALTVTEPGSGGDGGGGDGDGDGSRVASRPTRTKPAQ